MGWERASLDWRMVGAARSLVRFLAAFACSVLNYVSKCFGVEI